jgi:signal transduction histidine kinase/HAMP domain-containing protein
MRTKLIVIFLVIKIIPLVILAFIAWRQFALLGDDLAARTVHLAAEMNSALSATGEIAVRDSTAALNDLATQEIERLTTDTAGEIAEFLYGRDADILYLATLTPNEDAFRRFAANRARRVLQPEEWVLAPDGQSWVRATEPAPPAGTGAGGVSTNKENDDMDGFHYRDPDGYRYAFIPLYDEITFIGLDGRETVKYVSPDSTKSYYPLDPVKKDVSRPENTYVRSETYFAALRDLAPGEIYVSDVIGAYVGSNYIGMYTPDIVQAAAETRGYDIPWDPAAQAYAGEENPNGQRFEGIVRWATPVTNSSGAIIGYVTMALNHDHIMEFVDHITPMNERYTELPSAFEGNYAFIWDYKCRSIAHPRHHSIVGFDPATGAPTVPWLESSIYDAWQASGVEKWTDFIVDQPIFDNQSRSKTPAPALTQAGLVGLDGRYLNNAPQCTGWMDLTADGGSGSFYILWSGLYKLTTAGAIPYYTGQYAPSPANGYSRRGFGFVAIGAGLEDFQQPARETEERLGTAMAAANEDIGRISAETQTAIDLSLLNTSTQLFLTTGIIIIIVIFVAIWLASSLTNSITRLIRGISRFSAGERQFRFNAPVKDEFGALADSFDDMADSIVDSVKSLLSITDMERRIIYMNEQGLKFVRRTLAEVVGTPYADSSIYPADSVYCPITALEAERETEVYHSAADDRYVKGTASYLRDRAGKKIGYVVVSTDVTEMVRERMAVERQRNELRQTQRELEEAVAAANAANEHKGNFLARMSHEIRTPMNAIIGVTDIVRRKLNEIATVAPDIAEVQGHVQKIRVSSQHLLGLLNDILDISKIDAGKIELSEEEMNLGKLASTVIVIIKPRCEEKNITFLTQIDSFSTGFIGDDLRLRQVLINLLGNAVKFTPNGGTVEFRLTGLERAEGRSLVEFVVRDTGIGIAPEALDTVFEAFEQAGSSISRQFGGTGLGLAISRSIVELFGGEIMVRSRPDEGSEFSFRLWLRESAPVTDDTVALPDPSGRFIGCKMLLVDDVEINRLIIVSMLEDTGMEIDEANDGLVAVEKFTTAPVGAYDIVLMDIQMPQMDGYEAAQAIRAMDRPDARETPIIALTANAFKEDMDKALSCGMNAHIAKPIAMEKLIEVLFRFCRDKQAEENNSNNGN